MIEGDRSTPGPDVSEHATVQQFVATSEQRGLTEALVELNGHEPPLEPAVKEQIIQHSINTIVEHEAQVDPATKRIRKLATSGVLRHVARKRALARRSFSRHHQA